LPYLVDKDNARFSFMDNTSELAHGLRHQTRLQAHLGLTHIPIDLCLGHQGRYRVHHHDIECPTAHQHIGDFQSLFTTIGLRDEEVVEVHTQFTRIRGIQGMFGIDEGCLTTPALR